MQSLKVIFAAIIVISASINLSYAQWKTNSAFGSYSICTTGNTLFASFGDGSYRFKGVYRSTDFGKTWAFRSNGIPQNAEVSQILSDSVNTYVYTTASGIYKTLDNGESWVAVSTDSRLGSGVCTVLSSSILLVAKTNAILVSKNGGATWDSSKTGLPTGFTVSGAVSYPGKFIIGLNTKGIYESTDFGGSWAALNTGLSTTTGTTAFLSLFEGNRLYTSINDGKLYQLTYPTWTAINTTGVGNPACVGYYSGTLYTAVVNSPKIYYSLNNGSSWSNKALTTDNNVAIYSFFPLNKAMMIATMHGLQINGLYSTTDRGATFTQLSSAPVSDVKSILTFQNNRFLTGYFISYDSCKSWSTRQPGLTSAINSAINFGDTVLVGMAGGGSLNGCVYRSVDDGANWSFCGTGFTNNNTTVVALAKIGDRAFAATSSGVFVSTNKGTNWTKKLSTWGANALAANDTCIFAAINSLGVGAAFSSDYGQSWLSFNSGINSNANSTAIAWLNGKIYLGTYSNGIYISSDNGHTWVSSNNGFPTNFEVTCLSVIGNYMFAGVYIGNSAKIYYSSTNGTTWKDFSDGLPLVNRILSIKQFAQKIYAAAGNGLYFCDITDVSGIEKGPESSSLRTFSIEQNYPNPFNPSTVIRFVMPQSGYATLRVYDLLGREIRSLFNGFATAGRHEVRFNAEGLASGIYLYRLSTGQGVESRKMLLEK
ncbi:MAG: T9SS type A sorting domain-containing protein [Ignavibacteria bacterium]|nr:T9SS type A sorting domain-containing protein [Ignavibacteria bacterium]